MVVSANMAGVSGDEGQAVITGYATLDYPGGKYTLTVDGICFDPADATLMALSAVGSSTEIRAWRAGLCDEDLGARFDFEGYVAGRVRSGKFSRWQGGYRIITLPLGYATFHLVALARRSGFLQSISEEAVWQHLQRENTTPLDRRWMPWLMEKLRDGSYLKGLACAGFINAGLLVVDDEVLDGLVAAGLKSGEITIQV